jgi:hypothetical protein
MKQTINGAILGASITLAASLLLSPFILHQAKAAEAGGEQYKVVASDKFQSLPQLEQELNSLGADGWKVRTAMGSVLVLAK